MRVAFPCLAAILTMITLNVGFADEPATLARALTRINRAARQAAETTYRVECVVYQRDETGAETVVSRPVVATLAHQPATVQIAQATPLVTSVESVPGGTAKPNITVVVAGTRLTMKIAPDQPGKIAVDLAIERTAIESVDVTKLPDGSTRQSARIASQTTRVIDCIDLAKTQSIGLDDKDTAKSKQRVEFTVTEMKVEQPGE
jgi:hypothetical protein